jgi:hypothetical protein
VTLSAYKEREEPSMKRENILRSCIVVVSIALALTFALGSGHGKFAAASSGFSDPRRVASANTVVTGIGATGRLAKWAGSSSLGEAGMFEDKNGNIGVGTDVPDSKLTVQGAVESTLGGFKFPDGTVQATSAAAALTAVSHDDTLRGAGSAASPLSVASPIFVRDLDNPARQPVQVTAICEPFGASCAKTLFTVPAGKRLVVEYASANAIVSAGQVIVAEIGSGFGLDEFRHALPISQPATEIAGETTTIVSQQLRLYVDAGTDLKMSCTRSLAGPAGFVRMNFSGYLVDVQPPPTATEHAKN